VPVKQSTIHHIAEEPYRIFFPFALLAGILGAMLWPLFYAGGIEGFPDIFTLTFYPNLAHAHLMIEGFVGGFAVGFLGTAMPKMMMAKSLHPWQVFSMLGLHISYCTFHLLGYTRVGDALFVLMMVLMLGSLGIRLIRGKSTPPAGMILAVMGLISGTLGAAWMAAMGMSGDMLLYTFAQRLLYQAFILLPILGVGSFIFPMILGTKPADRPWKSRAIEGGILGALIILSYWIEAQSLLSGTPEHAKAMSWARLALCFVWLTKESGWLKRDATIAKGVMPFALRAGIVSLLGGMITTGIWQQHRIALDHSLYIGGFGLITMMVATRVLYGHSGQGKKFQLWVKPLTIATGLLLFGMLTRVTADFFPRVVISHHVYAAILWVAVSLIWGIALLPSVRRYPPPTLLPPKKKAAPSLMNMNFRK